MPRACAPLECPAQPINQKTHTRENEADVTKQWTIRMGCCFGFRWTQQGC